MTTPLPWRPGEWQNRKSPERSGPNLPQNAALAIPFARAEPVLFEANPRAEFTGSSGQGLVG